MQAPGLLPTVWTGFYEGVRSGVNRAARRADPGPGLC